MQRWGGAWLHSNSHHLVMFGIPGKLASWPPSSGPPTASACGKDRGPPGRGQGSSGADKANAFPPAATQTVPEHTLTPATHETEHVVLLHIG